MRLFQRNTLAVGLLQTSGHNPSRLFYLLFEKRRAIALKNKMRKLHQAILAIKQLH
ncbi:hypothetical protein AB4Y32_16700 [Paraburkholderia phymatum]|uniref:Uncharacterized protein n=1 Tax=Paraburkholderia phymatum TaxID=148447 RepID=A0ACC6U1I1_9BURK